MAKILVIDDEKETAELFGIILQKDGHQVTIVTNGQACLDHLAHQTPDLLLMDISMPEMDGYTLVSHLSADSSTRDIPVLVVSGRDAMKDTFQMFTSVVGFITKPFDVKQLRTRVAEIFAQRGVK